jgi:hypothetical protein
MARVYVFAIDWVPEPSDVASGGGLRSLQIIEALRDAGHDVGFAVPRGSRAVQALELTAPRRVQNIDLYGEEDQIDLLRRFQPDAVLWLWPSVRRVPFTGLGDVAHICDLNGLQDYELANGSPSLLGHVRSLVVASCQGADTVLTGAPEQHGYWLAQLSQLSISPTAMLAAYALPPSMQGSIVGARAKLQRLHFIGNVYSWSASTTLLMRAANWSTSHSEVRLHMIGGTDPGGATPLDDLRSLRELERHSMVDSEQEVSFKDAMQAFAPGSLALDLNEPTIERQLAVPIRTVNALMHGVPILTTIDSPLTRRMEAMGAAVIASHIEGTGLEQTLSRVAEMTAKDFGAMSVAARSFAEREFNYKNSVNALSRAVDEVLDRRTMRLKSWKSNKQIEESIGHVLVITDQTANLRELRVDLPFSTLNRRRLISGYSIWDKGKIVFSTKNDLSDLSFDAIWAQRSVAPDVALLLDAMDLPYVYDIDDNLLVSPAYREAFSGENLQAARNFVRNATVVSCSTTRLASIIQRYAATAIISKVIVTQNILRSAPHARPIGEPTCVVWASSDVPALTEDRLAVLKAIRDFCLTQDLRLVCHLNC